MEVFEMAAYAALVSLMHIIKQIQQHPCPPISLDQKQVDSLSENVTFLQGFLEDFCSGGSKEEDEDLERRIADAAYAAEDVIESHIVDQIHARSTSRGVKINSIDFYQGLVQRAIQDTDLINKEVEIVKERMHVIKSHIAPSINPIRVWRFFPMLNQDLDGLIENMDWIKKEVETIKEKMCVIESDMVDQIHAVSTSHGKNISSVYFYQGLQKVIEDMDLIKKKMETVKEKVYAIESHMEDQLLAGSTSLGKNNVIFSEFYPRVKQDKDLIQKEVETIKAQMYVIKSHIVYQIHASLTSHGKNFISVDLNQGLRRVIQEMDLIKKEVETIKEKMGAEDQLHRNSPIPTGSIRSASTGRTNTMAGSDNVINEIMHTLTGHQRNLQIIQIVGMGGIGKTTLARKIYENPLIVEYFHILAWVTISQANSEREILSQVLCQEGEFRVGASSQRSVDELGERVYRYLFGRRYLIVMDDIWNIETWNQVKRFFPDNSNGSRIMTTTRLSNLDFKLSGYYFQMNFLDEDESCHLLREIVFGNRNDCPSELEKIGKEIAINCRGLPLSIVVIGGLLTKSKMTRGYWEYTLENLNSLINLENNEHCLQILRASYKELPIHLKPCFLYMGVFPEDDEIRVSQLIKLWVAEGFLKPIDGKSLEVTAEEYLKELTDRSLILVHKLGWNGKAALCKIHDLLRDLCLREAQKQKFLCVLRQQHLNIPQDINMERRICMYKDTVEEYSPQYLEALESPSLTRSFLFVNGVHEHPQSFSFRLLRVCTAVDKSFNCVRESSHLEAIFQQANLRYLSVEARFNQALSGFPSSFSLLWNLQTLIVVGSWNRFFAPPEIWKMPLLRHVIVSTLELPDPSSQVDIVLENLQTLSSVYNLKCGKEVVKRIPNVKKLKLKYGRLEEEELPNYCHNNLGHLQKLESLELVFDFLGILNPEILHSHLVQNLTFPHSLRKLTLGGTNLHWKDFTTKIGPLPLLEFLKLEWDACIGPKWETVEGQFFSGVEI